MGKYCSIYIFESREDRRSIEMYQKLAELICRIDGFIKPQNIAEARKADKFYEFVADAYEDNKTTIPKFETRKGDCFLWVEGQQAYNDIKYLSEVARTAEEKELVSKVMIGYTCHYEAGYWFREREEDVQTRDFGKATELMRRPECRDRVVKPEEGELYYFIQGEDGNGFAIPASEVKQFTKINNFVNRHFVCLEFIASNNKAAGEFAISIMRRPYIRLEDSGEAIDLANYYDLLFMYFRRLQMSRTDLPANFWDWLEPEKEDEYFRNALLYNRTHLVVGICNYKDVA